MNRTPKNELIAILAGLVLPYLLLNGVELLPAPQETVEITSPTMEIQGWEHTISIRVKQGDSVEEMELEHYLIGVVLGEMPATFEEEALKAQAVVARTYTLRRRESGTKHENADICTDPGCCQAYCDPETYEGSKAALEKVTEAVRGSQGQVLTYQGKLIEATYFSSSGGRTEDALAVWGSDLPYLQAVDSPEEDYQDQYLSTVSFSCDAFQAALGVDLNGSCETWFSHARYTNGGGVQTISIGGWEYTGTSLRQLLGLRSTAFTVTVEDHQIIFTTWGYGHRVGMSQYGAEAMALDGKTYEQILAHYYVGTQLEEFIDTGEEFR